MERRKRLKNKEKWRRIIRPVGDSDSSDWTSDGEEFELRLNRSRKLKRMAGHSSSSSMSERPASPVDMNGEDVVQNNETSDSAHQLNFFKLAAYDRMAQEDVKPLGSTDVASSTTSVLHHNFAERNDNAELDASSDHFWLFARDKLSLLSDRPPYYLGGGSDRDCGVPALPATSSPVEGTSASTSNMSDCWAEYAVNLKRRGPPPPPPRPIRNRLYGDYAGNGTNGNQILLTGSSSIQDNVPSTSSDMRDNYKTIAEIGNWLRANKAQSHGYKRSCLSRSATKGDSVSQPLEDSSEIQIVSVMGSASSSSTPASASSYSSRPPPVKKVRWSIPEVVDTPPGLFYEKLDDMTTLESVEVINLEDSAAETSSAPLKAEQDTAQVEDNPTVTDTAASESCEDQQPGPSLVSSAANRSNEDHLLNEGIIGLLECPVCMEHMGPPINQCRRGHLICSPCKSKLASCPTCRSRFSEQRNLAMEKVAEKLLYPCRNIHMGCTQTLRLGDREEHELNCEYRNYRCAIAPPCDWRGQHQEILHHVRETHSDFLLFGAEHELQLAMRDFNEQMSQNWVVSALGELFRVNLGAVRSGRVQVFGCVIFLGPAHRASHFKYTLKVETKADSVIRSMNFTRTVHNYLDKCALYYSSGDSFHLRTEAAQLFSEGPYHILKVKLKIEGVEEHE